LGLITRQAELNEVRYDPYHGHDEKQDKEFVIKKLGISKDKFEEIMKIPVRTYKDYPSYAIFLLGIPRLRSLFRKISVRS